MNLKFNFRNVCLALFIMAIGASCKKTDDLTIPPAVAHFMNSASGTLFVIAPGSVYKIPIGVSTVSDQDRTVNISVSSTTGATEGTQFTLSSHTITIPAGKAVDTLAVTGIYDQYLAGRKDTLIFSIQNNGKDLGSAFDDTFRLDLRGPCFEGDVDLNLLKGAYNKTNEIFGTSAYGPYTTTVIGVNPINATSGEITVSNIFDAGWNPITFLLDWSDPTNRTVTLMPQSGIADAGTVNSAYAGEDVTVRSYAGKVGTFSACKETITLVMQIGVTGLGYFPSLYTVSLAR